MSSFAETLRIVMTEKGVSAVEIHNAAPSISQPYLSQLLNGKLGEPTFSKARMIISALGMTLDEFAEIQDDEGESPL